MKPQWQQQQEQMRQQQEQQRRQMGMAAWQQQKEAQAQKPPPDTTPREIEQFVRVEREVARLRQDLIAGHLTEEQFNARLQELMVQDEQGIWWMVGAETGNWYRNDGNNWVQSLPPGLIASQPTPLLPEWQVAFTKQVKQKMSDSRDFVKLLLFSGLSYGRNIWRSLHMGLFRKWGDGIGTVIEKWDEDQTNPGVPPRYCHYLLVTLVSGERVAIRLDQKYFDAVTIGDHVRFRYLPGKGNKKVKEFKIEHPVL